MRKYIPKFENGNKAPSPAEGAGWKPIDTTKLKGMLPNQVQMMEASVPKLQRPEPTGPSEDQARMLEKAQRKAERESRKSSGNPMGLSSSGMSAMSGISKGVSMTTDLAKNFIDVDEDSNFAGQQAVGDALMSSGNPYVMAAGAAFKALSAIDQATGLGINTIDKQQASAAGLSKGQRILNNVLGFLPGNPIAALASTKTSETTEITDETKQLSSAFGGSVGDISTASSMGGKRYLFGGSKINSLIDKANRDNKLFTEMGMTNTQRKQSDYGSDLVQQNINRYAGNTYNSNRIGKHGLKLMSVSEIKQLLASRKESEIQAFQNGGVIGVDVNVIAEGRYHAHKNHLEDVSEELSDLTKKGIPVVTHSEGGEIEQIAEIEKKELIFRLEVTNKLEELFKDGSDEAMIEAGKLVAEEIIENTQDNSGEVLTNE